MIDFYVLVYTAICSSVSFNPLMKSPRSRRFLLNGVGLTILLIGTGVSGFIYKKSSETDQKVDPQNLIVLPEDSRIYQRNVAMYAGTFGVLADEWTRYIEKLGEPKALSITIIVLTLLVSGGFFVRASRLYRCTERQENALFQKKL